MFLAKPLRMQWRKFHHTCESFCEIPIQNARNEVKRPEMWLLGDVTLCELTYWIKVYSYGLEYIWTPMMLSSYVFFNVRLLQSHLKNVYVNHSDATTFRIRVYVLYVYILNPQRCVYSGSVKSSSVAKAGSLRVMLCPLAGFRWSHKGAEGLRGEVWKCELAAFTQLRCTHALWWAVAWATHVLSTAQTKYSWLAKGMQLDLCELNVVVWNVLQYERIIYYMLRIAHNERILLIVITMLILNRVFTHCSFRLFH